MKVLRFINLMSCALGLGLAFAHLLEMPAKMTYSADLYLTIQHSLYWFFGTAEAVVEVAAVLSSMLVAFALRREGRSFRLALFGAAAFVLAHAIYWIFIAPINAQFATWTVDSMPADWASLRELWEVSHASRGVLMLLGFGFLLGSLIASLKSPDFVSTQEGERKRWPPKPRFSSSTTSPSSWGSSATSSNP